MVVLCGSGGGGAGVSRDVEGDAEGRGGWSMNRCINISACKISILLEGIKS